MSNQNYRNNGRRGFLKNVAAVAAGAGGTILLAKPTSVEAAGTFTYSVKDYGATGNGTTDDTSSFANALTAAGVTGGVVFVPAGKYRINGTLSIPAQVTLKGEWEAPPQYNQISPTTYKGSVLLAYTTAQRNQVNGVPFITLAGANAGVKGLVIVYPEQNNPNAIVPYPWTIRGGTSATFWDNLSVQDVLLLNPYQGVDFGTYSCGRHLIRNLYGQPLKTGIFIDQCLDVGRVENVHFWPFWSVAAISAFTGNQGFAMVLRKSDGQIVNNFFAFGYHVGIAFNKGLTIPPTLTVTGGPWGVMSNIILDAVNVGLDIYSISAEGMQIVNLKISPVTDYGQVGRIAVFGHNDFSDVIGPFTISNATFFGTYNNPIIFWEKGGPLTVTSSSFLGWPANTPAIKLGTTAASTGVRAIITDNWFQDVSGGRKSVQLLSTVNDRVIVANNLITGNSLDPTTTSGFPFRVYSNNI